MAKPRPWWETFDRRLWGHDDWIAFYVQTGHLSPEEKRNLNVKGAGVTPDEFMTADERRWLGTPSTYPRS